jgi:hypothetical protein
MGEAVSLTGAMLIRGDQQRQLEIGRSEDGTTTKRLLGK